MNFFSKYQKLLLILGFFLFIIAAGYLLYSVFFKTTEPDIQISPIQSTTTSQTGFPISNDGITKITNDKSNKSSLPLPNTKSTASRIAKGGLTKITNLNQEQSIGVTLDSNGSDLKYYNKNDGKFYKINKAGKKVLLSDKVFHNVDNVIWSSKNNKAIIEYPDGANIVYNFDEKKQVTLPTHWKDFDFSPQGDGIVMKSIGLDPQNRWLAITNDNGSKTRKIESIGNNGDKVYPAWSPNNQSIAMYTKGIDFDRQEVFFVGLNNENFKSTIVEGRGFQPKWAPKGDKLLYSVYSSKNNLNPNLWIVNAQGESIGSNRKNLNLATWAEKCTFSDSINLYCAVPKKLEEGSGLFPELALSTTDNLYKINTITGRKELVAIPDGNFNISNVLISDNDYYLYFTDSKTKNIYQVKLR